MTTGVDPGKRKRQRRAEVELRLRTALQDLAAERSFRDITVVDVTSAAGLSRSAFYFYFDDKRDLLIESVKRISEATFDLSNSHFEAQGDSRDVLREVLSGNASAWSRHADLLRLAIEASIYDEGVRAFWHGIVQAFVDAVAQRIRSDQAAGLIPPTLDADTCAEVMVTATEGFFHRRISRGTTSPEQAVEALEPIWLKLLYA